MPATVATGIALDAMTLGVHTSAEPVTGVRVLLPDAAALGEPTDITGQPLAPPAPADETTPPATTFVQLRRPSPLGGYSLTSCSHFGHRAWFAAAKSGDWATLRTMIINSPGKKILNTRGDWGMTALIMATKGRHLEAVQVLLDEGADPNITDKGLELETALHIAAYRGDIEIVRLLLLAGARPDMRNDNGRTPRSLAAQQDGGALSLKLQCEKLLLDWRTATKAAPVITCRGVAQAAEEVPEEATIYYFTHV